MTFGTHLVYQNAWCNDKNW